MRAAVFHLGILKWLAEQKLLGKVSHISTVSGASICMGLIYGANKNHWPKDHEFLQKVLPVIEKKITGKDIQWTSLVCLLIQPYYWDKKVNLLAKVMEYQWCIHGCMQDIPAYPRWTINTTSYESGKDFRISSSRMGEHSSSFVMHPTFRLSHAMAASAGFPVLIGPYKLKTGKYTWVDASGTITVRPRDEILHLWDGGVYDNMGLDPLFRIDHDGELNKDINYLIVSNASGTIEHKKRKFSFSVENLKRLLDINMDQVESLKSRSVIDYFQKHHNGMYIKIGTRVEDILKSCPLNAEQRTAVRRASMSAEDVRKAADYKTTLERMSLEDFQRILTHGYELAAATWAGYDPYADR